MASTHAAFSGSVPQNYDQHLGPLYFDAYADDLVRRVPTTPGLRVLEVAAGTGIVTEKLRRRLDPTSTLTATDLNQAMIDYAVSSRDVNSGVEWQPANAQELPFEDGAFDIEVCQYGVMFFPDKPAALKEAARVLKPGGRYLFNVWDSMEHNPVARLADAVMRETLNAEKSFFATPFGLYQTATVEEWLRDAGFSSIQCENVRKTIHVASARSIAQGNILGTPSSMALSEAGIDPTPVVDELTRRLNAELGEDPFETTLSAFVFDCRKG